MLILSVVIGLVGVALVVYTIRNMLKMRKLRRVGTRITGEVIDNEARSRSYYGGYYLYPVVRYSLDGKWKEGTLRNWQGKIDLGSNIDLIVDPKEPWSPMAVDGDSTFRALVGSCVVLLGGMLLTIWAIRG